MDNADRFDEIKKKSKGAKSLKDLNHPDVRRALDELHQSRVAGKASDVLEAAKHFFQAALKHLSPSPLRKELHDEYEKLSIYTIEEAMKIAESLEAIETNIAKAVTHPDEAGVYVGMAKLAKISRLVLLGTDA